MIYSAIKLVADMKRRREELGYSQAKLSTVTGYDRTLVHEWEAGGNPRLAAFVDVVQQLGGEVSITWKKGAPR